MAEKQEHVKVGPPVDEREDDGRKHDHLGPRPRDGEHGEELKKRADFLRDVHAKVLEPSEQGKPSGSKTAQTK